jgi:HTH-type transcriptional regulator, competence development regulator
MVKKGKFMKMKNNTVYGQDIGFGEFVRNRRLDLNIGLREFATKLDLSPAFISKMEIGDFKPPKEENIKKMAIILGIDQDELLARAGKISSDLQEIISTKPALYASLLRRVKSSNSLSKILDDMKEEYCD